MAEAAVSGRNRVFVDREIAAVKKRDRSNQTGGPEDGIRPSRILIPETTPLLILAMVGPAALDWLFVPGAEVWVTDLVREKSLQRRSDDDQRDAGFTELAAWFEQNEQRIHVQTTVEGEKHRQAMQDWRALGSRSERKPKIGGRPTLLQVLEGPEKFVLDGKPVLNIADDGIARDALKLVAIHYKHVDINLMTTESFLAMIAENYHVKDAEASWMHVKIACGGEAVLRFDP